MHQAAGIHYYQCKPYHHSEKTWASVMYAPAIENITAEEIDLLAAALMRPILNTLDLGMGVFHGSNFTEKRCDRNSSFMKAAIPFFEEQMRNAFSNGAEFSENGMEFQVLNAESSGILNQVALKLNENDREALQKAIETYLPGVKTVTISLKISHLSHHLPPPRGELCFCVHRFTDGKKTYEAATDFESLRSSPFSWL